MKYKLMDLLNFKTQGVNTTTDHISYVEKGYKIVQAKNIAPYNITFDESNFVDEETFSRIKDNHKLHKGEVLYTNIGSQLGNSAIYEFDDEAIITWNVMKLIPNKDIIDNYYLCYLLNSNKSYIKALNTSSTMPFVSGKALMNVEFEVPDLQTQKKVIKVLKNIEDKIKLNNEINNNLHELMKIMFNNCIDNLEEYEESVLSKIANYKNGLAMQKFRPIDESGLPVIKIKEMNSGITSETERCRSDIDSDVIIDNADILFAWSGTLCMSIWCEGRAGLNQHIFKVTSDKYPKWFYYFWTLKYLDNFIEIAAGKATTMGHIKRTELDKAIVKIPNEKIMEKMDKIFTPMFNEYVNNSIESKNLSELRDTLLPKLMNGEIDLDNIEI